MKRSEDKSLSKLAQATVLPPSQVAHIFPPTIFGSPQQRHHWPEFFSFRYRPSILFVDYVSLCYTLRKQHEYFLLLLGLLVL